MEKHIDIEKDVVSFQQAINLCMIGFNEKTLCAYEIENQELYLCHLDEEGLYMPEKDMPAPLRSQVFRWFREKKLHNTFPSIIQTRNWATLYRIVEWHPGNDSTSIITSDYYDTYEEAENACIDKLIELAKQQDNGR